MPRPTSRLLLSALALVALVVLSSTHATALPHAATVRPAAGPQEAAPGLFARIWDILSSIWTTGSGLEPNGAGTSAGPGADPAAAGSGDIGSILDPNG
jgi:hypothetical protein